MSSELDCSHFAAKRQELDSGAEEINSPSHSPKGQWSQVETSLQSSQSGEDISSSSTKASLQFAHPDLFKDTDIAMPNSLASVLLPRGDGAALAANPQRDIKPFTLPPQPGSEYGLQSSETCFGMV
jgi:hypothetical protein